MSKPLDRIRNIAIIAHVDHGKTTLVDKLLGADADRVMDSNALESERGITILAKCTAVDWKEYLINIIDTPGHRDFGGEVERALSIVEGVLLVIDAAQGIEQQTKFVARKALELGLTVICVVNKVDREGARPEETYLEVLGYLQTVKKDIEPVVIYASGRDGWAVTDLANSPISNSNIQKSMAPLLDLVVSEIPSPKSYADDEHLRMTVRIVDKDRHLGRLLMCKIDSGEVKEGQFVIVKSEAGDVESGKITKILKRKGMVSTPVPSASVGDIVWIAGFKDATVGYTLVDDRSVPPIKIASVDPPTLSIVIEPNTSPLRGTDGAEVTSQAIQSRILNEAEKDVSLKVEVAGSSIKVAGRGEMHLGVLLENMRREGFEMTVYAPEVVRTADGKEPWELLCLDVDAEHLPPVMAEMQFRRSEILSTTEIAENRFRMECLASAKNLLGYRSKFLSQTQGSGGWNQAFHSYREIVEGVINKRNGALVSTASGETTAYAMNKLEDRGDMFVLPGTKVYEGMIIGEHNKEGDLDVNPVQEKKLTNIRAAGKDDAIKLRPAKLFSIEDALVYIEPDECIEITPKRVCLRKKYLQLGERRRAR